MSRVRLILTAIVLAVLAPTVRAQTSYPMVARVEPVAVQRGKTVEITFAGTGSFAGAWMLLAQQPGLSGEIVEAPKAAAAAPKTKGKGKGMRKALSVVKAKLTVAPDAPLGPREVRIATPQGVSSVGLVVVVNDPVVPEADDKANDTAASAQLLELPCVVTGTIAKTEDVDWYAFPAKAGQRVTFSVWANRLENKIHDLQAHFDPILILHDAQGRELAVDDNHDFADPMLSYECKEAGTYYLEIRDTTYTGNANWTYALQATSGPFVTSLFPMAVNPGAKAALQSRGWNFDNGQTIALDVPAGTAPGAWLTALPTAQGPSIALPVVVTKLPVVREAGDAQSAAVRGQAIAMPAAVSGKLGEPNDIDSYQFEAKKGQIYAFEVVARRAGSMADPVLRVINVKDALMIEGDDFEGSKDPRLEWTAPADGLYALQITDLHGRGSDDFGYVIEAEAARPDFVLTCDPDKYNVGPGGRVPVFFRLARRSGFTAPVTVEFGSLPPGIVASPLTIPANMTEGEIILTAVADAKPAATFVTIQGKAKLPDGSEITRAVNPRQEYYSPGGGRGVYPVETLALCVTDESDITVEAKPTEIVLAPGQTATIDVTVTRHGGYDKGVNLAIAFSHLGSVFGNPLPPGVTLKEAGSKTLLGPKETQGKIILEAKPDAAACEKVPFAVMGHVSINFVVKTSYASAPITLTVTAKK